MDRTIRDISPRLAGKVAPEESCANCRFCIEEMQFGRLLMACSANPPQLLVVTSPQGVTVLSMHPGTEASHFCRLFERRPGNGGS